MGQGAFAVVSPASRATGGELRFVLCQSGASRMIFDEDGGVEHTVGSGTIQGLGGNGTLSFQRGATIAAAVAGGAGAPGVDGGVREADERRRESPECGDVDGDAGEGTRSEESPEDPVLFRIGKLTGEVSVLRSEFGALRGEVGTLRYEVGTLRKDMYSEFGALRTEMHREFDTLRGEIGTLRTEVHREFDAVRGEIGTLRTGVHREFDTLRGEVGTLRSEMTSRMDKMREEWQGNFKFLIRLVIMGVCVPFYISLLGFLAHTVGLL